MNYVISKTCPFCGNEFLTKTKTKIFCSKNCCREFYRYRNLENKAAKRIREKVSQRYANSNFDERIKEADACGLSYGYYSAQLRLGKTFEELKAAYERRLLDDF